MNMNMNQKEKLREILILLSYSDDDLIRRKGITREEIKTNLRVVYELDQTSFDKLAGRLSISRKYLKGDGPYIFDYDENKVVTAESIVQNQRLRDIITKFSVDERDLERFTGLSRRYLKSFLKGKSDLSNFEVRQLAALFHISMKYIEGKTDMVFDSNEINEKMEKIKLTMGN